MNVGIENEPGTRKSTRRKKASVTRIRALIVEEEPALSLMIKEVLEAADIEDVTLLTRMEARAVLHAKKFDVILIDVIQPFINGSNLVHTIRDSGFNQNTLIIMMSEDQRPAALAEAFRIGASFFVYKPIDRAHLTRLIRATQGTIEQEKRRFRRVLVRSRVGLKSDNRDVEGVTVDLSLNGALVHVPHTFPVGSKIEVSLYLAGAEPVVGKGTVTRVAGENYMGIEFKRLPAAESGRLQEYLLPLIEEDL